MFHRAKILTPTEHRCEQASAERRDLVPERCRSWSFQVVSGTSTTKNHIWNGTTRNKERQISKKNGNEGKYLERGHALNEVVPGHEHSTGTGFLE